MTLTFDRRRLVTDLLAASRRGPEGGSGGHATAPDPLLPDPLPGPATDLPPPARPVRSLASALADRTAVRHFAPAAVGMRHLAAVLVAADEADARGYGEARSAGLHLELFLAALRVDGLSPACYRFAERTRSLVRVGPVPAPAAAEAVVLQREFARAPALLIVSGPLAAAVASSGEAGHRELLSRAGGAAYSAWLAALRVGLVGTTFAGLLPSAARRLLHADGYRRAPLFAFALGHPLASVEGLPETTREPDRRSADRLPDPVPTSGGGR